jgi:hypothetical protein
MSCRLALCSLKYVSILRYRMKENALFTCVYQTTNAKENKEMQCEQQCLFLNVYIAEYLKHKHPSYLLA